MPTDRAAALSSRSQLTIKIVSAFKAAAEAR